ncbi:MAG: hypothetical protein ACLR2E_03930 [Lachnospiraceae bacterium]
MTFMQCYTTGDGNNPAFFSDAEYDELVNACKTESDNESPAARTSQKLRKS